MSNKEKLILLLIVFLAAFLRIYKLDKVPPNLSNDEISIAYDAYSVSKTLRDEWNQYLPVSFRSHNTYKAPLTIYLTVPSIKIFGNNEIGARMPSVIFGTLTIIVLIFLVKIISQNTGLALLVGFLLSITPWHVHMSRMILEANIALFFVVLGVYLFYRGLFNKSNWSYLLGFISFALSLWGYHTEWGLTPILIFGFYAIYRKKIINKRIIILGVLIFLILVLPLGIDAAKNINTHARANTESIFMQEGVRLTLANPKINLAQKTSVVISSVINNYSQYINPAHLFYDGLNVLPSFDPFQIGLFYLIFLPLGVYGLFYINKYYSDQASFIYLWVLTAPLIPAVTRDAPNSVRNLVSVVPYIVVIATGLFEIIIRNKKNKPILITIISLIFISFVNFYTVYQNNFPIASAMSYQYGYKQIALYIKQNYQKYKTIIIDPRFGPNSIYDGVPRLYIPFYTELDPQKFLNERRDTVDSLTFDKYQLRWVDWKYEKPIKGVLYVVPSSNIPEGEIANMLENILEIKYPTYDSAFKLYSLKD